MGYLSSQNTFRESIPLFSGRGPLFLFYFWLFVKYYGNGWKLCFNSYFAAIDKIRRIFIR
ncbi:hypothetical protein IB211_02520 [Intestinimonas butyriciproducens]|uniref:Uncharacterized protein n=1 Tax=Intestinimonas butyriciproducens TaxID=1297617 RepID=A0A0S2W6J2_9FIRM|nr:hypothetical protein IB211_02520 [Intestinimonas butyriciproducens]